MDKKTKKQKILFKWSTIESKEKNFQNYWLLVLAGGASLAMFMKNALAKDAIGAMVFILLAIVCFVFVFQKPKLVKTEIIEKGIKINNKIYYFKKLESFWIVKKEDEKFLRLKAKKTVLPFIFIPLGKQDFKKIAEILANYLPAKKETETLVDI